MVDAAVADMSHKIGIIIEAETRHGGARCLCGSGVDPVERIIGSRQRLFEDFRGHTRPVMKIIAKSGGRSHACHFAVVVSAHTVAKYEGTRVYISMRRKEEVFLILLLPYLAET